MIKKRSVLALLVAFGTISCCNDSKDVDVPWENYSTTMNGHHFDYNKETSEVSLYKVDTIHIFDYKLHGILIFDNKKVIIQFDTINNKSFSVLLFDYALKKDTIINYWPVLDDGGYTDSTVSYTTLDTSFYYLPYQDTIYKFTIANYCGTRPNDNVVYFTGYKSGIVGCYTYYQEMYAPYRLYNIWPFGNLFFDIFYETYREMKFYPHIA